MITTEDDEDEDDNDRGEDGGGDVNQYSHHRREPLLTGWIWGGEAAGRQERATRRENEGNERTAGPKRRVVWAPCTLFAIFSLFIR